MAIDYNNLHVIDTFEVEMITTNSDGSKTTVGTGQTKTSEISRQVDKIEIRNGIGQQLRTTLKTKKQDKFKVTVDNFDLEVLALKNGIELDKTSKKTLFWDKEVAVTTASATVSDASRVLCVKTIDGKRLKMITGDPTTDDEVKVSGTTLTLKTGSTATKVLVTYEGDTTGDNFTIVFDSKTFAKSMELLCHTIAYDEAQGEEVADVYCDFYKCMLNDDFSLSFNGGDPLNQELEFDITVPQTLPDGTLNSNGHTGVMYVTEMV